MKTKYVLFLLIISLSGCTKFLEEDPKGLLVGDAALSNINGLNAQLVGMYGALQRPWNSGFASAAPFAMAMGGDDLTTNPASNKEEFREFDQFAVKPYNSRQNEVWFGCYKAIQAANNIIANYEKAEGDPAIKEKIAGEAYFFRGMCYYYLTRWWGKVPLLTEPTFPNETEMLSVAPSEIADIYNLIESDLIKAETMVPDVKPEPGRINKGSVKAYLADVYLTESGWPLKDASKAALAAQKAKEVIDNKNVYGFDLHSDFYKIFGGGTKEDVFAMMMDLNNTANTYYGWSSMPGEVGGWEDYCAEINFFQNFPAGSRKDATFLTQVTLSNGTTVQWENFAIKHPFYKKFMIQNSNPDSYASNSPIIMMRYSNVLLVYAEAVARSSAPTADAYAAINAVRQRAGLANLTSGLSKDNFINAVIAERGWEFAGEWSRWFDLIRTETVAQANSNRDSREVALIGDPADQTKWHAPIPGTDKDKNPNL